MHLPVNSLQINTPLQIQMHKYRMGCKFRHTSEKTCTFNELISLYSTYDVKFLAVQEVSQNKTSPSRVLAISLSEHYAKEKYQLFTVTRNSLAIIKFFFS